MQLTPEIRKLAEAMLSGQQNSGSIPNFDIRELQTNKIAVSLTCHQPYLKFLFDQIHAINHQIEPAFEKFLFLDNCEIDGLKKLFPDWKIVHGNWGSPNPGRNIAINETKADWIVFADADDIMKPNYLQSIKKVLNTAKENVGIVYADLEYCDSGFVPGRIYGVMNTFDYWEERVVNAISACSAWRIEMLKEIGGIDERINRYDDWSTALDATAKGWHCVKNTECNIQIRKHDGVHRNTFKDDSVTMGHKMLSRSYGVVTLFAGRENCLANWEYWLMNAELPEKFAVYAYDNSRNPRFTLKLLDIIHRLQKSKRFIHVDYTRDYSSFEPIDEWTKHRHVNNLYNTLIPRVKEDMILFWEDDLIPPLNGLRRLIEENTIGHAVGGISAAYSSRSHRNAITAAFGAQKGGEDYWHDICTWDDIKKSRLLNVDFIAGGFALYNNGLVQKSLPFRFTMYKGKWASGWDSHLSRFIRNYFIAKGRDTHKLRVVGDVYCEHLISGDFNGN